MRKKIFYLKIMLTIPVKHSFQIFTNFSSAFAFHIETSRLFCGGNQMTGSNVNSNAELKRVKIFPHQVSPYRNLCIANQGGQQNIVRNKCLYFHFNNKKVQCIDLHT